MRSIVMREAFWHDKVQQRYFCMVEDNHLQAGARLGSLQEAIFWLSEKLRIRYRQNGSGVGVIFDRLSSAIIGAYEWQEAGSLLEVSTEELLAENIEHLSREDW